MTESERKAVEWLDQFTATAGWAYQVRTLKSMLARPVMPEPESKEWKELRYELSQCLPPRGTSNESAAGSILYTIRDELARPPTKEVEVWHSEWVNRTSREDQLRVAVWRTKEDAERDAENIRTNPRNEGNWVCIRVTGPHKQTVPA